MSLSPRRQHFYRMTSVAGQHLRHAMIRQSIKDADERLADCRARADAELVKAEA